MPPCQITQRVLGNVKDEPELFFLSAYSPDLSEIAMLWRKTRRNVINNKYFEKYQRTEK
jgi:transposase